MEMEYIRGKNSFYSSEKLVEARTFFYCSGSVFKITVIANQMFSGWYFMVDLNLMILFCVYNFIILRRLKRPKL